MVQRLQAILKRCRTVSFGFQTLHKHLRTKLGIVLKGGNVFGFPVVLGVSKGSSSFYKTLITNFTKHQYWKWPAWSGSGNIGLNQFLFWPQMQQNLQNRWHLEIALRLRSAKAKTNYTSWVVVSLACCHGNGTAAACEIRFGPNVFGCAADQPR